MCVSLFCSHAEELKEFEEFEGFECLKGLRFNEFIDSMFYTKTLGITTLKVIYIKWVVFSANLWEKM